MQLVKDFIQHLYLRYCLKSESQIYLKLIEGMVGLELGMGQFIVLASHNGAYGIRASGGFRPVFQYDFHTGKEWVNVKIVINSRNEGLKATAYIVPSVICDGDPIAMHPSYLEPFYQFSRKLADYFPFTKSEKMGSSVTVYHRDKDYY